ncbi:peroxidasin homolog [Gigantopelta aegis]|uniref:peroxidasin homolog n=1 Tax=Gigantopelta aegis TaxID=1735272 RepID=UPI001B88B0E6|nr:peroxidasin homolog [Gigantopelta aegis]
MCRSDASGYSAVINSPTQITLTIQSFNTAVDAGEWVCRDGPTGDQTTCIMTVQHGPGGPNSIKFGPASPATVKELQSLTVICTANCTPSCSFSWSQGRQNVSPSAKLELTNISKSNEGVYTCTAKNIVSSRVKSRNFTLVVIKGGPDGPNYIKFGPASPATVTELQSLTVICTANCTPSCSFSWTRGSQNVSSCAKLELTNISKSNEGVYTCTAKNTGSSDIKSRNFTLVVIKRK